MKLLCISLWVVFLCLAQPQAQGAESPSSSASAAHEIESRLIAPCCWRETLDVHQSPLAAELRREIRTRLAAGESAAAIEGSLVARYGPKIRATLPDKLGYLLFGLSGAAGLLVLAWLRIRHSTRAATGPGISAPEPELASADRQRFEEQLDDELAS